MDSQLHELQKQSEYERYRSSDVNAFNENSFGFQNNSHLHQANDRRNNDSWVTFQGQTPMFEN